MGYTLYYSYLTIISLWNGEPLPWADFFCETSKYALKDRCVHITGNSTHPPPGPDDKCPNEPFESSAEQFLEREVQQRYSIDEPCRRHSISDMGEINWAGVGRSKYL